jgi:hypothetical protein
MAIAWAYTKSTNTAVVTGGTSGTPATFATFVTADRAGSVTLLAAWAPNSNTKALTYQITPVELLALLISFVVASKTTETDYIFVTGTDAWGAAQTEAINVSAGNGTYVSTKRFRTITNIDCSDSATGGGTVWADGTVAVTQPQWGVIWDLGNSTYKTDCVIKIGNGSTSTYFISSQENWLLNGKDGDGISTHIYNNATLELGRLLDASTRKVDRATHLFVVNSGISFAIWFDGNGVFNSYGTQFSSSSTETGKYLAGIDTTGIKRIWGNSFSGFYIYTFRSVNDDVYGCLFDASCGLHTCNCAFNNIYFSGIVSPSAYSVRLDGSGNISFSNVRYFSDFGTSIYIFSTASTFSGTGYLINFTYPSEPWPIYFNTPSTGTVYRQYYCNLNICDKNGTALSGVTVDCTDKDGTAVWTPGTVTTDVNGNITQQTISSQKWVKGATSAGTLTTYSPHKFTISKAGYQTLVLENITVSAPIVWHLELRDNFRLLRGRNRTLLPIYS